MPDNIQPIIPGSYNGSTVLSGVLNNVSFTFINKQEGFNISINGLIPNSVHYLFLENNKVLSTDIKPAGGKIGDSIYTDANGMASFTYYYKTGVTTADSVSKYNEILQRLSGDKTLVLVNCPSDITVLPDNFEGIYTSFARKTIYFKTSKVAELPISANYNVAYQYTS
jgi:hypothetical protein